MKKNQIIYNSINILFLARVSLTTVGFSQENLEYLSFKNQNYEIESTSINSDLYEYAVNYYKDNQVVYSAPIKQATDKDKDVSYVQLFLGTISADGNIINPKPFPLDLNSEFHEAYFAFTKNGAYVYFTNGDQNSGKGLRYSEHLQLYGADIINDSIQNITLLEINETVASTAYPFLADNDKTLYFTSNRYGGYGGMDLYKVEVVSPNVFGEVENLGPKINSPSDDMFSFIDNNNVFYFSSDRQGTNGGLDVYAVDLKSKEKNVFHLPAPLNSLADDYGFIISNNIGFVASDRKSGKGADDIYTVKLNSLCVVSGVVVNKETQRNMTNTDVLVLKNNNIIDTLHTNPLGKFTYHLKATQQDVYKFKAVKSNFNSDSLVLTNLNKPYLSYKASLKISENYKKNHLGKEVLNFPSIYFESGAWNINSDATVVLNEVIDFLNDHASMIIEVDSHTDCRGSKKSNEILSHKRAKSTLEYLVSHGILSDRLSSKGFGELEPVNHCVDGVKCSKEEYQLNRRTEFVIVKK